ncbi:MAG: OadG family protein [Eubacteriales bacterium]|nr:OadG family protein [Eubacteriales bacterium]
MRNRLKSLLAAFACILALTACGGSQPEEVSGETRTRLLSMTETTAQLMDTVVTAGAIEEQKSRKVIYDALLGWESVKEEIGAVDFSSDADGNGVADCFSEKSVVTDEEGNYIVTVGVTGDRKSADLVITYDKDITDYMSITTNVEYSFQELIEQAGTNTLLGMGTTFAVLILLSVIIAIFGAILTSGTKSRASRKLQAEKKEEDQKGTGNASGEASGAKQAPAPETAQEGSAAGDDDGALIAVISAAVAACLEEESAAAGSANPAAPEAPMDPGEFVARKIRRIGRR